MIQEMPVRNRMMFGVGKPTSGYPHREQTAMRRELTRGKARPNNYRWPSRCQFKRYDYRWAFAFRPRLADWDFEHRAAIRIDEISPELLAEWMKPPVVWNLLGNAHD